MRDEITFNVERDEQAELMVAAWDDPSRKGGITTQGVDLKALQECISEAVHCHFDEQERPCKVRLHFITDPVFATT